MTPEEAHEHLAAIRRVIDRSRAERARSGDIYVAWGVAVVTADVIHLALDARGIEEGWVAWPIASILAGIYTTIAARRREQRVLTFGARIEATLWTTIGIAMTIVVLGGMSAGILTLEAIGPLICSMVAVAMITSSTVFESRLMRASGVMFLVVGAVCLFFPWRVQYGLFGAAVLVGYILPGLWWIREERRARDG